MRVDGQEPGTRRERWTSGPLTAKSISIKGAKRRPGDRARKATELTPGDLLCVAAATGSAVRRSQQAGAAWVHARSRGAALFLTGTKPGGFMCVRDTRGRPEIKLITEDRHEA